VSPAPHSNRWWVYQRERFPVFAHGVLILAFSASAVSFSAMLRGAASVPTLPSLVVAFLCSFLSFLHLRIADEFKDLEDDTRHRPYRPVPRGLVTLRELGAIGVGGAVIQLLLALWLQPALLLFLFVTWTYLALMSREFFVGTWLKARPIMYLWTHMLIMPLIDFFAAACDWSVSGAHEPPPGIFLFVVVSFFNGCIIEIGRKIRSPADEEPGVSTYSVLWGGGRAAFVWLGILFLTGLVACVAADLIGMLRPALFVLGSAFVLAAALAIGFALNPQRIRGKWVEAFSGIWTLVLYIVLGAGPMLARLLFP